MEIGNCQFLSPEPYSDTQKFTNKVEGKIISAFQWSFPHISLKKVILPSGILPTFYNFLCGVINYQNGFQETFWKSFLTLGTKNWAWSVSENFQILSELSFTLKLDSHLPKKIIFICYNESPLKIMKNAFYFTLKALFVLKIFKFLSWHFGHVEEIA